MKKIFSVLIIIVSFTNNICYATNTIDKTNESIELIVTAPETIEEGKEDYIITLFLGELKNIQEEKVMAFQTTLEYNEDLIENIAVKGNNEWILTYSNESKILLGDIDKSKKNKEIGKIEVTLKKDIKPGQKGTIILKDMLFISDKKQITLNKTIDFEIIEKKEDKQQESNTNNSLNITDNTIANQTIPAAGIKQIVVFCIIVGIVLAVIFKFKSRKIKY